MCLVLTEMLCIGGSAWSHVFVIINGNHHLGRWIFHRGLDLTHFLFVLLHKAANVFRKGTHRLAGMRIWLGELGAGLTGLHICVGLHRFWARLTNLHSCTGRLWGLTGTVLYLTSAWDSLWGLTGLQTCVGRLGAGWRHCTASRLESLTHALNWLSWGL